MKKAIIPTMAFNRRIITIVSFKASAQGVLKHINYLRHAAGSARMEKFNALVISPTRMASV
jgi:hypothetical protein